MFKNLYVIIIFASCRWTENWIEGNDFRLQYLAEENEYVTCS